MEKINNMLDTTQELENLAREAAREMKEAGENTRVLRRGLGIAVTRSPEGQKIESDFESDEAVIYSRLNINDTDYLIYAVKEERGSDSL